MTPTSYEQTVRQAREDQTSLVLVDREGSRAVVTLNDPEKLNPLSAALTVQLREALEELAADHGVRAIRSHRRRPVQRRGRPEADARHRAPDGRRGR